MRGALVGAYRLHAVVVMLLVRTHYVLSLGDGAVKARAYAQQDMEASTVSVVSTKIYFVTYFDHRCGLKVSAFD